jgi:hypothetical protein
MPTALLFFIFLQLGRARLRKTEKAIHLAADDLFAFVGVTGFEPAATRPPDVYSTGLSYTPLLIISRISLSLLRVLVGVTGFEPTTSSSRTKRATGLRYTPSKGWVILDSNQ